ncbi:MAG: glycosyltransferase [Candidatus Micrarchaeota archaeon]|nr:glycosyltransferase [Candidatus Micrarchaeota archaeon]MDE1859988.1 glycosyltransferase [Candidatus Micrarchaeota archaeon]
MPDIKVAILNMKGNFDKTLGMGTQRTSYELWKHIRPLAPKAGVDVTKVEVGVGSRPGIKKVSFTVLLPLYNFSRYDIVHLLIPMPHTPFAGKNTSILTTINEFVLLDKGTVPYKKMYSDQNHGNKNPVTHFVSDRIGNRIHKQIFNSDYLSVNSTQTMAEAIKLGYPKERIFIINHGVDERFLSPIPKKRNMKFRIGFIGALNIRKNMSFAIDAFKKIDSGRFELEIWGKPLLEYNNLVEQAKDDNRIKFMGFAAEERIVSIYDRFDAFVFPSLYEGFGLPIIEAQARGLPVIIYKGAKIPAEIRKYCLEAKDEKRMAQIITDLESKGYENRKASTAYARKYTRQKEAQDTLEVYRKIYERGKPV